MQAWREGWWELPLSFGNQMARLLDAEPDSICMQPNVTLASAVFLSSVTPTPQRNRIVATDLDFPSVLYLYDGISRDSGFDLVSVPADSDGVGVETDRLLDAIDEKTAVVAISHVAFRSSFIHDIHAVVAKAHQVGAKVLLDCYHSAGVVPFSLRECGADAAVGGNLKWLLGGPGVAFLYVRPDLLDTLQPRVAGWMGHERPFGFELPPMRPAEGIARFLHGTPSIPSLRAAEPGLAVIMDAGVEAIREKSLRLTGGIIDFAQREGWKVRTPLDSTRRGGTVSLEPPHAYGVSQALLARKILIDYRPEAGIRMAPHFYSTESEVDAALQAIVEILNNGEYRTFENEERPTVT